MLKHKLVRLGPAVARARRDRQDRLSVRRVTDQERGAENAVPGRRGREWTQALTLANRELEIGNSELEAFSLSVSHELRTPLQEIIWCVDMYAADHAGTSTGDDQRLLNLIRQSAERMHQLIDDQLRLSRLSRQQFATASVSMESITRKIAARLRFQEPHRSIELVIQPLPDCIGDPSFLEQVLLNLLSNAFKFTAGREPALIEVGTFDLDGQLVYFVRDNGVGFDMRCAQEIFEVFRRLHAVEQFKGTGVGLWIVDRIVKAHGGVVWAEAEPERGATFYFTIPQPQCERMHASTG
jgi:light-regulated signal transduction histidine kinase (bacteriophytochrome)